jgi:ABC-type nitrate/sulfonate/bicarbonate transport system substrate-binding protein
MRPWPRVVLLIVPMVLWALPGELPEAGAGELTKVTYVLQWAPDVRWAGEYLAKERGYFAAEGLDVTITNQRGSLAAIQQVGAGGAEFACPEGGDVLVTREKGVPVRSVALLARNTPIAFMSLKETNITKPEDLIGKKVGVQRASSTFTGFQALMAKHKIDIEKLEKIEASFGLEVLLLKKVDMRPVFLFNEYVLAQHKGIPVNIMWLPDFGINLLSMTIATTEKMIRERPQIVQAFVNASLRGREAAIKDPKAAMDAFVKHVPDVDRPYQEKVWAVVVDRILGLKEATKERPYGFNDPDLFRTTAEVLVKYSTLKKVPPLDEVYDNRFVEAYYRAKR